MIGGVHVSRGAAAGAEHGSEGEGLVDADERAARDEPASLELVGALRPQAVSASESHKNVEHGQARAEHPATSYPNPEMTPETGRRGGEFRY